MTESLAPLRHGRFRMLSTGRIMVMLGNAVAPIALAFAVLDLTGSVASLGLVVGARSLTNVLFILFGGIVADRIRRSMVLVGSSYCSALTQATVATLVLTHTASIPLLIALSALNGASSAFAFPASSALTSQTVPANMVRQAVALIRLGTNAATIAGASLGGLLVSLTSPGWGLAIDATTFAVAGACFARIGPTTQTAPPPSKPSFLAELRQGWTEFTARTWVWLIVVGFCFINAGFAASNQVLGPAIADHTIGRRAWGLILAVQTAGMLLGALTGLKLRPQRPLLFGVASCSAAALIPLTLAIHPTTPALCAAALAGGVGIELFSIAWETSLQQHIPPARLARVYSYDALGSFLAIPIAQTAAGPIAQTAGFTTTLLAAAAIVLTATAIMIASHSIRTLQSKSLPGIEPALSS